MFLRRGGFAPPTRRLLFTGGLQCTPSEQPQCVFIAAIINVPSSRRFCTAHRTALVHPWTLMHSQRRAQFVFEQTRRFHRRDGQVLKFFDDWHCGHIVPEGDLREAGCLQCFLCDICPRDVSVHYFRTGSMHARWRTVQV